MKRRNQFGGLLLTRPEIEAAIKSLARKGVLVDSGRKRWSDRTGRFEIVLGGCKVRQEDLALSLLVQAWSLLIGAGHCKLVTYDNLPLSRVSSEFAVNCNCGRSAISAFALNCKLVRCLIPRLAVNCKIRPTSRDG
jgi:hypothetical protein